MAPADVPRLSISFPQLLAGIGIGLLVWLLVTSALVYTTRRNRPPVRRRHWFSRLLYVTYLGLIAVLATTAFGSIVRYGHLAGNALLYHVVAAGGFVFLMVAIAFLYLPSPLEERDVRQQREASWWAMRWSAWALVGSSLMVAATMLISMLPLLDTSGLRDMATLHRYAGVAVVISAILHLHSLICLRLGWR